MQLSLAGKDRIRLLSELYEGMVSWAISRLGGRWMVAHRSRSSDGSSRLLRASRAAASHGPCALQTWPERTSWRRRRSLLPPPPLLPLVHCFADGWCGGPALDITACCPGRRPSWAPLAGRIFRAPSSSARAEQSYLRTMVAARLTKININRRTLGTNTT